MLEDSINIGDEFEMGSARVVATQPRMPCYKLWIRFGMMDIVKRFLICEKTGVYFNVLQESEVAVGDLVKVIKRDENNVTVKDIVLLYVHDYNDAENLKKGHQN